MSFKRSIKRMGKTLIALKQETEKPIKQSVLLVDNGYSWSGQPNAAVGKIRNYFPEAEISVLTFEQRKSVLEKDFPELHYILPPQNLRPRKYQIALQMFKMRRRRYDYIFIFSLDITPIICALIFLKTKVVLYNRWGQCWSLRLRNVTEVFKVTYVKKKTRFSLKNFLKRFGLFFILLKRQDEEALKHSILVVDNGYTLFEHLDSSIYRIKEALPSSDISVLTLEQTRDLGNSSFDLQIIKAGRCLIKKYSIARHMLRLRNARYDYIVILSLDISPIIVSILLMHGRVILYNRWHQWWSLNFSPINQYFVVIFKFVENLFIFIYLFFRVLLIFVMRFFNILRLGLFAKENEEAESSVI